MSKLFIREVEVTNLNPLMKTFTLVVHIKAMPIQMYTPAVEEFIYSRVRYAIKYLIAEGFIPDPIKEEEWTCIVAGQCHPPV